MATSTSLIKPRPISRLRGTVDKPRPVQTAIGERRKFRPNGRPGFMRVDSVRQSDLHSIHGTHHTNLVDEVIQFPIVGFVERISDRYLPPVLEALTEVFPFVVQGFYIDNGSECINRRVDGLFTKLHVQEFTKSRARRTNDNASVKPTNGSVVQHHQ